jgi:hypothetical protein
MEILFAGQLVDVEGEFRRGVFVPSPEKCEPQLPSLMDSVGERRTW